MTLARPTRPGAVATASESAAPVFALPSVKIGGVEYLDATKVATSLGLTFSWTESERRFKWSNAAVRLEFPVDSREIQWQGQRVFLGDAVRIQRGQPLLSRRDVERLLAPVLQPGRGVTRVPALKTIMLDPGHGGEDHGTVNPRLRLQEKTATLDTALRLKKLLEAEGYQVVLTRDDDRRLELTERAVLARGAKADLFISIHFNSIERETDRQTVNGIEVYTMTPQRQLSTDLERDNQVDVFNPGNGYDHWNAVLGFAMHRQLLRDLKVPDRGLKRGRKAVLRLAPCPAVLVESGYISHDAEARKIATGAYRQKIAEALADGVRSYDIALTAARKKADAGLPR